MHAGCKQGFLKHISIFFFFWGGGGGIHIISLKSSKNNKCYNRIKSNAWLILLVYYSLFCVSYILTETFCSKFSITQDEKPPGLE